MTNYEKIKNMSVEEMTTFIGNITEGSCACCGIDDCYTNGKPCTLLIENGVLQWLNKEVSE